MRRMAGLPLALVVFLALLHPVASEGGRVESRPYVGENVHPHAPCEDPDEVRLGVACFLLDPADAGREGQVSLVDLSGAPLRGIFLVKGSTYVTDDFCGTSAPFRVPQDPTTLTVVVVGGPVLPGDPGDPCASPLSRATGGEAVFRVA